MGTNDFLNIFAAQWLRVESVDLGIAIGSFDFLRIRGAAKHDHYAVSEFFRCLALGKTFEKFEAVHPRHIDIDEDQTRWELMLVTLR